MHERCEKEVGGKPRTVKQLMGSRRAKPIVLGFIVGTRQAQRAQRQKQEEEWQERKRNEARDLEE